MKVVLATTRSNIFIEALLAAYRDSGGPRIHTIIFLADRNLQNESLYRKVLLAVKVFGFRALFVFALYKRARKLLWGRYRRANLTMDLDNLIHRGCSNVVHLDTSPGSLKGVLRDSDILVSIGAPVIFKDEILDLWTTDIYSIIRAKVHVFELVRNNLESENVDL